MKTKILLGGIMLLSVAGYMPAKGQALIDYCPVPSLSDDAGTDLDGNNFYFVTPDPMDATSINRVGIGASCGDPLNARLDVRDNGLGFPLPYPLIPFVGNAAINAVTAGQANDGIDRAAITGVGYGYGAETIGIFATAKGGGTEHFGVKGEAGDGATNYAGHFASNDGGTTNYGVFAEASGGSATTNYGVSSYATNGTFNFGIVSTADATSATRNFGIAATGSGSATDCYGGNFEANCTSGNNIGVYAAASGGSTNLAALIDGAGVLNDVSWTYWSDGKLKKDVKDITGGLETVLKIQPKEYYFDRGRFPSMNLAEGRSFGVIAQELEEVLPELVRKARHPAKYDEEGLLIAEEEEFKGVLYTSLIPFTIQAIKEQQAIIEEKEVRISKLEGDLEALKTQVAQLLGTGAANNGGDAINSTATATELHAAVRDLPVLSQNVPNPFSENTTIRFYLPKGSRSASIKVYDQTGAVLRMFSLTGEGTGSIDIEGGTMAAGSYYYSLVADGYQVDSKTLVLTK